ncbi:uncharacterized protein [Antedon mediterranea]|uniref:uncharacterized protein n=1 Tax=Antedon mediterranea TaxID=105859 RepID=UPI003AF62973
MSAQTFQTTSVILCEDLVTELDCTSGGGVNIVNAESCHHQGNDCTRSVTGSCDDCTQATSDICNGQQTCSDPTSALLSTCFTNPNNVLHVEYNCQYTESSTSQAIFSTAEKETTTSSTTDVTSNAMTSPHVTTLDVTTSGMTSAYVTTSDLTSSATSAITSSAVTTSDVTSSSMTSSYSTTGDVAFSSMTSPYSTTSDVMSPTSLYGTTSDVTPSAITSPYDVTSFATAPYATTDVTLYETTSETTGDTRPSDTMASDVTTSAAEMLSGRGSLELTTLHSQSSTEQIVTSNICFSLGIQDDEEEESNEIIDIFKEQDKATNTSGCLQVTTVERYLEVNESVSINIPAGDYTTAVYFPAFAIPYEDVIVTVSSEIISSESDNMVTTSRCYS